MFAHFIMYLFSAQWVLTLPVPKKFPVLQLWATPTGSCQESWWPWQLWQLTTQNCGANQWCQRSLYLCFTHWHHLLQKPIIVAQNTLSPPLVLLYMKSLPEFHKNIQTILLSIILPMTMPPCPLILPAILLPLLTARATPPTHYNVPMRLLTTRSILPRLLKKLNGWSSTGNHKLQWTPCHDYQKIEWMK